MKNNAIIRIIIWSILFLILTTVLLSTIGYREFARVRKSGQQVVTQRAIGGNQNPYESVVWDFLVGADIMEFPSSVQELEINWACGPITILPGDTNGILVEESGSTEKYPLETELNGNKLTIDFSASSHLFRINTPDKQLVIMVPRDWSGRELIVSTASGQLSVSDLSIQEVTVESASAQCSFENCRVGSLELSTASGNVRFSGTLDTLECSAASAKLDIEAANIPSEIHMSGMSGALTLTLPESAGFTASVDTISGNFSSSFPTVKVDGSYICGDGQCEIEMSGVSSDIRILSAVPVQ